MQPFLPRSRDSVTANVQVITRLGIRRQHIDNAIELLPCRSQASIRRGAQTLLRDSPRNHRTSNAAAIPTAG